MFDMYTPLEISVANYFKIFEHVTTLTFYIILDIEQLATLNVEFQNMFVWLKRFKTNQISQGL